MPSHGKEAPLWFWVVSRKCGRAVIIFSPLIRPNLNKSVLTEDKMPALEKFYVPDKLRFKGPADTCSYYKSGDYARSGV